MGGKYSGAEYFSNFESLFPIFLMTQGEGGGGLEIAVHAVCLHLRNTEWHSLKARTMTDFAHMPRYLRK